MRQLEICCDSLQSAIAAMAGGATRVELCANLLQGGTTPSSGTITAVRQQIASGLHVLIRPRGGDFCYSAEELAVMRLDILHAKQLGADGVVLGALLPDGSVDQETMRDLIALARPLRVTFHRAFDLAKNPLTALGEIIALGADYLLTSGQQPSALAGAELIAELNRLASGRIAIMPGGGINENNIAELARITGVLDFHSSGRSQVPSRMQWRREQLFMGAWQQGEYVNSFVDEQRVRLMVAELSNLA